MTNPATHFATTLTHIRPYIPKLPFSRHDTTTLLKAEYGFSSANTAFSGQTDHPLIYRQTEGLQRCGDVYPGESQGFGGGRDRQPLTLAVSCRQQRGWSG